MPKKAGKEITAKLTSRNHSVLLWKVVASSIVLKHKDLLLMISTRGSTQGAFCLDPGNSACPYSPESVLPAVGLNSPFSWQNVRIALWTLRGVDLPGRRAGNSYLRPQKTKEFCGQWLQVISEVFLRRE